MRIEDVFDDPDDIGASEYRLLYDFLSDIAKDNADWPEEEQRQHLVSVLNEVVDNAISMIHFLKANAPSER